MGLYIEEGKTIQPLNTRNGEGNFYLSPNGVFFIKNDDQAGIALTGNFKNTDIKYATQSGPMLVIDGKINAGFTKESASLYIRNDVGITRDNKTVFKISNVPVSLYDFAEYFFKLGCENALYLDGAISNIYVKDRNTENA